MRKVFLRLIHNRKKNGGPKIETSVELRLTFGSKVKYVSTGVRCTTREWNDGEIVRRKDCTQLNDDLHQLMAKVSRIVRKMEEDGIVDLASVPRLLEVRMRNETFWDYIERRSAHRAVAEPTRGRYESFLKMLKKFGKLRTFEELTATGIRDFDEYLHEQDYKQQTIHSYHKFVKIFINDAMIDGLMLANPYKGIKIKRGDDEGINKYLTEEEVERLQKCKPASESLERVRDLFVFCCYTGMAYSDMATFDSSMVYESEGRKIIIGNRKKTGKEYFVMLLEPALEILDKYYWKLPVISNVKFNLYLKALCASVEIGKPVTSHWARHTSAMLLLNHGVPIEVVAKILGHSNIKITQKTYGKIEANTVADNMQGKVLVDTKKAPTEG